MRFLDIVWSRIIKSSFAGLFGRIRGRRKRFSGDRNCAIVCSKSQKNSRGRILIEKVRSQESDDKFSRTVLALIQGIIFYKFPSLKLTELETMLDLGNFRQTPLYHYKTKNESKR